MIKHTTQKLGAHFSISNGLEAAIKDAESIQCTTAQIFLHSNRQWAIKKISPDSAKKSKTLLQHSAIAPLITHASYLINLASDDKELVEKSKKTLLYELNTSAELGIPFVVIHPGSNANVANGLKNIICNINEVFDATESTTMLLIENTAGQGKILCRSFEEIATILNGVAHKKRIGVCFDTCHAFAAGYNFTTKNQYEKLWNHFDEIIGMKNLKVLHLNDSKKECGSHVDRHENISKGSIGLPAFGFIMNDKRLTEIPKILETPYDSYENVCATYKNDMETLLSLII